MKNQNPKNEKSKKSKFAVWIVKGLAGAFVLLIFGPLLIGSIYAWQSSNEISAGPSQAGLSMAQANLLALQSGSNKSVGKPDEFQMNVQLAHAAAPAKPGAAQAPKSSDPMDEMYTKIGGTLTFIIALLQKLMWPVLLLIGGLMRNDILFGGGMEERLLLIWTNVRNLVNILFVLVLLAIALYNVLGLKNQEFQIKTIMPKFIIALIAVNFSFIGLKVVIDGINVVSTAIFAMPDVIEQNIGNSSSFPNFDEKFCTSIYGKDGIAKINGNKDPNSLCTKESDNSPPKLDAVKSSFLKKFSGQNFALFMAIAFEKIADLNTVKVQLDGGLKQLSLNMAFSLIFTLVYGTAFLALFAVLLGRLAVLWMSLALCPLIALKMVLPQKMQASVMGSGDMDIQAMFVKNAIAPIPIALVMTIGFIMMKALNSAAFKDPSLVGSTMGLNFFSSGLSTLQELIVAAATAVFVWKGVFATANNTIAKSVTKSLGDAVEGIGKFAATSWQYVPMLPVTSPDGKSKKDISFAGAMGFMQGIPDKLRSGAYEEKNWLDKTLLNKSMGDTIDKIKDTKTSGRDAMALVKGLGPLTGEMDRKEAETALWTNLNKNQDAFRTNTMKDESGNPMTKAQILDALKSGNVSQERLDAFLKENGINEAKVLDKTQAAKEAPKPGSTEAKKAEAEAAAAAAKTPVTVASLPDEVSRKKVMDAVSAASTKPGSTLREAVKAPVDPDNKTAMEQQVKDATTALAGQIDAIRNSKLNEQEKKAAINELISQLANTTFAQSNDPAKRDAVIAANNSQSNAVAQNIKKVSAESVATGGYDFDRFSGAAAPTATAKPTATSGGPKPTPKPSNGEKYPNRNSKAGETGYTTDDGKKWKADPAISGNWIPD